MVFPDISISRSFKSLGGGRRRGEGEREKGREKLILGSEKRAAHMDSLAFCLKWPSGDVGQP